MMMNNVSLLILLPFNVYSLYTYIHSFIFAVVTCHEIQKIFGATSYIENKERMDFKFLEVLESKWHVTRWDLGIIHVASFSRTFWVVHSLGINWLFDISRNCHNGQFLFPYRHKTMITSPLESQIC